MTRRGEKPLPSALLVLMTAYRRRMDGLPLPCGWYVASFSADLSTAKPLARVVCGTPLALFRATGDQAVAVLDRCPHRNVPLSCGAVRDGLPECCYHGWRFDAAGACRTVPGPAG